MRKELLVPLLILLTSCASATTPNKDFTVTINHASEPHFLTARRRADVKFDIEITNNTGEPYTIEEITLQSIGGNGYGIPGRTRVFKTRLAPGERQRVAFWTIARVDTFTMATDLPIGMRARIESKSDSGRTREDVYTQRFEGRIGIVGPFSRMASLTTNVH